MSAQFLIGTSGWTYDHWKGSFYPTDLARSRWFDYYAGNLSTVEVNATFYRTFKDQTYLNWKVRAPQGFGYVLKAPRLITHRKYLADVKEDIQAFYHSCTLLADKFELILLQVAPNTPYDLDRLEKALLAFPDPARVAVEFRQPEWQNPETYTMLRSVGATICNVDSPRQQLTDLLTSNRAYLRLHGRKRWYAYDYSADELREITSCVQSLLHQGAKKVYVFFNNDFNCFAPLNARSLKEILDKSL